MKRIGLLLALVCAALVTPGLASATPLTETEAQSVVHLVPALADENGNLTDFAVGEGQGYTADGKYYNRTIAELENQLESGKDLRVPCSVIAAQVAQNFGLPLEGCSGLIYSLRNDPKWRTEPCNESMFSREGASAMTVTNVSGTRFGAYHRSCYPKEMVLSYDHRPGMSLVCLNVIVEVKPVLREIAVVRKVVSTPIPVPEATEAPPSCPKDARIFGEKLNSLPEFLKTRAQNYIRAAKDRHTLNSGFTKTYSPDDAPDVSRSMGPDIRNAVGVEPAEELDVQVFFGTKNGPDRNIPSMVLTLKDGKAISPLSDQQWNAQVVAVLWPDYLPSGGRVVSPTLTHPRNGWSDISILGRWMFFFKSERDPCSMVMVGLTAPADTNGPDLKPIPGTRSSSSF